MLGVSFFKILLPFEGAVCFANIWTLWHFYDYSKTISAFDFSGCDGLTSCQGCTPCPPRNACRDRLQLHQDTLKKRQWSKWMKKEWTKSGIHILQDPVHMYHWCLNSAVAVAEHVCHDCVCALVSVLHACVHSKFHTANKCWFFSDNYLKLMSVDWRGLPSLITDGASPAQDYIKC